MMGQEHISYVMGYSKDVRINFLCDPHEPSLSKARQIMDKFHSTSSNGARFLEPHNPMAFNSQDELLQHAADIDLLVIASPNYLHTPTLMQWGKHDLTILVEKPVAVSQEQIDDLRQLSADPAFAARIWVAMEYRFIPAIAKLVSLIPAVGEIKMVTIRENRYPFLHKIGKWNRDSKKTGDTLVEKCCHFFDLFRLITGEEANLSKVRALAQRGLNYGQEKDQFDEPIIDSAFVTMPFQDPKSMGASKQQTSSLSPDSASSASSVSSSSSSSSSSPETNWRKIIGCLELCMFAEGSRHQEEVIVTGTKGRLEAYLPENKVYMYQRPSHELWKHRNVPPPAASIQEQVFECSDVKEVHGIDCDMPTHGGYHYSSTGVEWHFLLSEIKKYNKGGSFHPQVSLDDGIRAVEIGIQATASIVNATNEA